MVEVSWTTNSFAVHHSLQLNVLKDELVCANRANFSTKEQELAVQADFMFGQVNDLMYLQILGID